MKFVKQIIASTLATMTLTTGVTGVTAFAEDVNTETDALVYTSDAEADIEICSTTGSFSYNCTKNSPSKIGKVVATSTSIIFKFSSPTVGQASIQVRKGSYSGSKVGGVTTPAAGNTSATLTSRVAVTKGTTYYIVVYPANDYAQAVGGFSMTY